jgi:hypothetical protein
VLSEDRLDAMCNTCVTCEQVHSRYFKRHKESSCGTASRKQLAYKQIEIGRLRIEILVYRDSEAVVVPGFQISFDQDVRNDH